jgi:hypothetical protein
MLLMFIGFTLIMGPLQTFAKVVPLLGSLVGGVTSIVAAVFTLLIGSTVIALAWFSSRPLLSLSIVGVGVAIAFMLGKFGKKAVKEVRETTTATSETPPVRQNVTPPSREVSTQDDSEEVTPPPRIS